nr:hypothetical protein [Tanacetum cinerariifolium]
MIQKECSSPGDDTDAKREKQAKERCLIHFRILHKLLEELSNEDLANTYFSDGFKRAFGSLFGEDVEYFAPMLFFNMDKLETQLNKKEFNVEISMVVFKVFKNQFQQFITKQVSMYDDDDQMANGFFTGVNEITMQAQEGMVNMFKDKCDVGLVVTESSGIELEKQDESSSSGKDTRAEGADIRLYNDTEPMNEVQSTAACNEFANDKQHAAQSKFINEGRVDKDAEQRLDKHPLLASLIKNKQLNR